MTEKNVFKEKKDLTLNQLKTRKGLWDFFWVSLVLGFVLVNYTSLAVLKMSEVLLPFIQNQILLDAIVFLLFGIIVSFFSLSLSWIFHKIYEKVFEGK